MLRLYSPVDSGRESERGVGELHNVSWEKNEKEWSESIIEESEQQRMEKNENGKFIEEEEG